MFFVIQTFILNTSGYKYQIWDTFDCKIYLTATDLVKLLSTSIKYNSQRWYGPPLQLGQTNLRCICLKDDLSPYEKLNIFINNSQVIWLTFISLSETDNWISLKDDMSPHEELTLRSLLFLVIFTWKVFIQQEAPDDGGSPRDPLDYFVVSDLS